MAVMGRRTVFVVDDDESVRAHLQVLLSALGYDVVQAASGQEALSRLAADSLPALVMLDLMMPGLSGLQVLDRLKAGYPQVPVVILSAVGQIRTVVDAMNRGGSDYLSTTVQGAELRIALENSKEQQL